MGDKSVRIVQGQGYEMIKTYFTNTTNKIKLYIKKGEMKHEN